MAAPPASFPDAGQHGANHADDGDEAHNGEEPRDDDIRDDDPVERLPWSLEMSMKLLLCHNFIFLLQKYEIISKFPMFSMILYY